MLNAPSSKHSPENILNFKMFKKGNLAVLFLFRNNCWKSKNGNRYSTMQAFMGRYSQKLCAIQTNGEFTKACDEETTYSKGTQNWGFSFNINNLEMVTTD